MALFCFPMEKSFLTHLIELRRRLIYMLLVLSLGIGCSYPFAATLFQFLTHPLEQVTQGGHRLIYTSLTEAFLTYLKISFLSGLVISLPFILWQIWLFLAPGLHKQEKKIFGLFVVASPFLFLSGAGLAYYGVCPLAWKFFLSFETPLTQGDLPIQLEARMSEYLSLVLKLIFAFGLCFQLPLILLALTHMGLITLESLKRNRKYAFLIIVILAAILTPPDIISPLSLLIPLYALYEMGIILIQLVARKKG